MIVGFLVLSFASGVLIMAGDWLYTILQELEIVNTHNSFTWNALCRSLVDLPTS